MREHGELDVVDLPSPTAMPLVLALGISLLLTGLVTNVFVGLLGLLLAVRACVGWFFQVLPHEQHMQFPFSLKRSRSSPHARCENACPPARCIASFCPSKPFG